MVRIVKVWSFEDSVNVELDDGITSVFSKTDVDTKAKLLSRLRNIRDRTRRFDKAREKGEIDPSLKGLKELEGTEVE